ncbi:DUF4123 domain-containing protein [Vibrio europaeus]|uniref:DUF4123 domain-containing protein n=1 Tax=Vibrio europaeus TaxID=300876 RepID=A0A178JEI5_9VIBR|nr:DUF4123 domain-containing protein [Vibrio europaeus]MDC5707237.1 DUF4123 domain-containing protein [Vibrio europaeus]MDC5712602.1 DUF4123 domain-containing protein [Vibrio europaeus]MDC5717245.1 DUF4123 domain-containing protein [Vibrio europaeus]MDC5721221.1 DUF4123 domain-containing protein [Vibrio europaeus]MDC5726545.1 DUF4123 domain-containing protein [Vibrio europaeus]
MKLSLCEKQQKQRVNWYALVNHYDNMLAEVFQKISDHTVEPLYLTTPLESLLDRSPLVVSLKKGDALINSLPQKETLYFAAPLDISFKQVLQQLRNRLQIQFDGDRKGLFHYYLPSVASYFFFRASQEDSSKWLGCLSAVCFYKQVKSEVNEWVHIEGEFSPFSSATWLLAQSQEQGLNDKFIEQEIDAWAQAEDIQAFDWKNQKSVNSFCTQHQIEQPKLLSKLRHLVHTYSISLDNRYQVDTNQTSENIVKQLEQLISREYNYVC